MILAFILATLAQDGELRWRTCPDGSPIYANACRITPSGTYSGTPSRMAPDGSYTGGSGRTIMCPDGTYVTGTRCRMLPDGRYVGE